MIHVTTVCLLLVGVLQVVADSKEAPFHSSVGDGKLEALIKTESAVLHIEANYNKPGYIIFSDLNSLKQTNGEKSFLIAGLARESGYKEGAGNAARFNWLSGFTQLNSSHVVAADYNNHCLRLIDVSNNQTSPFVGKCTVSGYRDGNDPLFNHPYSVIFDEKELLKLIVSDYDNQAIRSVDLTNKQVSTILKSGLLNYPVGMCFNDKKDSLYVTNEHFVSSLSLVGSKPYHVLTGSKRRGHKDGKFAEALFSFPTEIAYLGGGILVTADEVPGILRIINLNTSSVASICTAGNGHRDGDLTSCRLNSPRAMANIAGYLYIGEHGYISRLQDSGLKLRVDIEAQYDVTCSRLKYTIDKIFADKIAEMKYSTISEICKNACTVPKYGRVVLKCSDNLLTVRWPTENLVSSYVSEDLNTIVQNIWSNLRKLDKKKLEMTIFSTVPPVAVPKLLGPEKLPARVILTPVCDRCFTESRHTIWVISG